MKIQNYLYNLKISLNIGIIILDNKDGIRI